MRSSPEITIDDVAGAILDGMPVEWSDLESRVSQADAALLGELRLLATLRSVARADHTGDSGKPTRWGTLLVHERIGSGAFGDVYRAWDTRLDREVALKLLPIDTPGTEDEASSVIEEGRLLARVRHPNVVTIYGADRIGGRAGLWMEFVRGRTLDQMVREGHAFGPEDVGRIGRELCAAVSAVHGAGLLHRDIKAQNVMIARDGRVMLMDFGTGLELAHGADVSTPGTPLYLAPEVLGGGPASVRSDIYAIGVLLYYLLTRAFPVRATTLEDLRLAQASNARVPLRAARPDVPRRLARIVERAIDPRPQARYSSVADLDAELASMARGRRRLMPYAAAAAAIVAILAGSGWYARATRTAGLPREHAVTASGGLRRPDGRPAIAVLPFDNLSSDPATEPLVDGLTDEIIRNLVSIDGLDVRSRTSSFYFKGKRDLRHIGEQLNATHVVEGSVVRDGERLRIHAQLVRLPDDVPIWSDRFDRHLADVFAIQDEISRAIVDELRLTLGRGQRRHITDPHTYEQYLQALGLVARRGGEDARRAADLFEHVIARDRSFAPAYAGLARAYGNLANDLANPLSEAEALPRMKWAALKALELDPLLSEAHAATGRVYVRELQWAAAKRSFEQAIELNPTLTANHEEFSHSTLLPLGETDAAIRLLMQALVTDPLSATLRHVLGNVLIVAKRYDEAVTHLGRVRTIDPTALPGDVLRARALTLAGRLDEALPIWDSRQGPGWVFWAAPAYVAAGRRAEVERMAVTEDHPFRLALIYTALGDKERALEALNRAVDVSPERVTRVLNYPELDAVRDDPRFAAVKARVKLP